MAKQRDDRNKPDDSDEIPAKPGKTPPPPEDELEIVEDDEIIEDAEVVEDEDVDTPADEEKKRPAEPTKIGRPAQPTMMAKDEPEEIADAEEVVKETKPPSKPTVVTHAGKPTMIDSDKPFLDDEVLDAIEAEETAKTKGGAEELDEVFGDAEEVEEVAEVAEADSVFEDDVAQSAAKPEGEKTPPAEDKATAPSDEDLFAEEMLSDKEAPASPTPKAEEKELDDAEEVAEEVLSAADSAEPGEKAPVSADDVDLNEIFEESKSAKETMTDFKVGDEAKPIAAEEAVAETETAEEIEQAEEAEEAEEEEELVAAGPGKKEPKTGKANYLGRWVGGFFLGIFTLVLVLGGLWYFQPNLLRDTFFTQDDPRQDPGVKAAISNLTNEKDELQKSFDLKVKQFAKVELSEKKAKGDVLALSKTVNEQKNSLAKAQADKKKAESERDQIVKVISLIDPTGKADPSALAKSIKELAAAKATLATVNKRLAEAKVGVPGEKGVERILGSLKEAEQKLAEVDQLLADAKVKGVQELVDLRKRLETERNELDTTIKAAFKELADAKMVPAGGDPRKELVAGAKAARQRSESPLVAPFVQLASSLGGVGSGAGDLVKRGLDYAAKASELASARIGKLVPSTPTSEQPDVLAHPNPALAEQHFARGLSYYWNAQYPLAEEQFKQAASYYNQDARYQYFLGLSQLAQQTPHKRRAAEGAFAQGAVLEAMNRPHLSDINASLERVQGPARQTLNSYRAKR